MIGLGISSELISLFGTTLIISLLGSTALTQNNIITQYLYFMIPPLFAIRQAAMNLVSNVAGAIAAIKKIGSSHPIYLQDLQILELNIKRCTYAGIAIGVILAGFMFATCASIPKILSSAFVDVNDPKNHDFVDALKPLFAVVSLGQIPDAVRNIQGGALNGMGNNTAPAITSFVNLVVVALALSYSLGVPLGLGLMGVAIAHDIALSTGALMIMPAWSRQTAAISSSVQASSAANFATRCYSSVRGCCASFWHKNGSEQREKLLSDDNQHQVVIAPTMSIGLNLI